MPNKPDTFRTHSTHTTGNDPIEGADPGGTRPIRPDQRDARAHVSPKARNRTLNTLATIQPNGTTRTFQD